MPVEAIATIEKLNHFYGEGELRKQTLFDINLTIRPQEFVMLTGPSGSGKSTLLSLIGCLRSLQDGSLKILGRELNHATPKQLVQMRRNLGYITQSSNLLNFLTARQNVQMSLELHPELSAKHRREKATAILEEVGLGDRLDYYPDRLSGGQRQRVAIACALVTQPKLILADEPTAALDKTSGRRAIALMHRLAKERGSAVVMVTHDNRILDLADRIINLEDGKLGIAIEQELSIALPGFDEALLERVTAQPTTLTYASEEIIIRQGEPATKFYLLLEGDVEVFQQTPNQPAKLLNRLHRGDYFGEIGLLQGGKRTATVRVSPGSEAKVMVIEQELFHLLATNSRATSSDIARQMRQRLMVSHLAGALPHLNPEHLAQLLSEVEVLRYGANSNIIQKGDRAQHFYLILQGQVEVLIDNERGQQIQREILSAGDYFGEQALMTEQTYDRTVRVLPGTEVEVLTLDLQDFGDDLVTEGWGDRLIAKHKYPRDLTFSQVISRAFPSFDQTLLAGAEDRAAVVTYAAGEAIVRQGELATKFYIILEGTVEVVQQSSDQSLQFLRQMRTGEYFGEIGLLQGKKRSATVRATRDSPVKVMAIDEELFQRILNNSTPTKADIASRLQERVMTSYLATTLPNLSPSRLLEVLTKVKVVYYQSSTKIVERGTLGDRFYLIVRGSVEVLTDNGNGRKITVKILQAGDSFGEAEILNRKPYEFTVRAESNAGVEMMVLDRQSFCNLLIESNTDPERVASFLRDRLLGKGRGTGTTSFDHVRRTKVEQKLTKLTAKKGAIAPLLILATLVTATIFIFNYWKFQETASQELLVADTSEPEILRVTALGYLEPQGEIIYLSASDRDRRLAKLLFKEGETVKIGQIIAVMDGIEIRQAEVESAQASVKVVRSRLAQIKAGEETGQIEAGRSNVLELEAQLAGDIEINKSAIARRQVELNKAKTDYQRFRELGEEGIVSQLEVDEKRLQRDIIREQLQEAYITLERTLETGRERIQNARAKLNSLLEVRPVDISVIEAELEEAIAQLQKAKADLDSLYIRSPIDGQILTVNTKIGERVSERGIVAIGQTQQMYVTAEVYESDIQYVRVGRPATIISEYGGFTGEINGVVEQIGLQIDSPGIPNDDPSAKADVRVVKVKIRLNFDDSERVKNLNNLQVRIDIQI